MQLHHVEPIVQVTAKAAAQDLLFQVPIRSGDDPGLDHNRTGGTNRNHLTFLDRAQELHLGRGTHLPDLVEEERPRPSRDQEAILVLHRSREGPFHVTEELALQQALRQRSTVDREEGLLRAVRPGVDITRDDLFACSALPREKNRRTGRGHGLGQLQDLHESGCSSDRPVGPRTAATPDHLLEPSVFHLQLARLSRSPAYRK